MAANFNAILRIKAVVGGVADVNALNEGLKDVTKTAVGANKEIQATQDSKGWRQSAAGATATAVALAFASKSAIDFESSLADVRKVVSGLDTVAGFNNIKEEILGLSRQMPITAEGFTQIYAAAGASGIAREELRGFAVLVGKVATAFDMTAQEAGTALAQMRVSLGISTKEVEALADAMNYVADNTGASAAGLVDFMTRAGATGKLAGLSGEQTMAFGAAMTQAGIESETAATSFNNLVKALSAGSSMTERQMSALERLGYAYRPAVVATRNYTTEAEAQSRQRLSAAREEADQRVAIARIETHRLTREIDNRYRQIKQQLQDQWEDERDARDQALNQANKQASRTLQRQQDAEVQALNDRYDQILELELSRFKGRTDDLVNAEQEAIRRRYRDARQAELREIDDRYEEQRDAMDMQQQNMLKAERRAARDRENIVINKLENQQRIELESVEQQQKNIEKAEAKKIELFEQAEQAKIDAARRMQKQVEDEQKKNAESAADAWKLGFAEQLQTEGTSFIMEVLKKINELPKAQQVSVMRDLFGDEARGLPAIIANVNEFARVLGLATDQQKTAGSVTKEYGIRSQTTANQLIILNNSINELKIAFGEALLPILKEVAAFATPLVQGFAGIVRGTKDVITAVIKFLGIGAILGQAAGPLVSFAVLLSSIFSFATLTKFTAGLSLFKVLPGPIRLVAAALTVLGVSATPLGPILNAVYVGLLAFQAIKFAQPLLMGIGSMVTAFTGFLAFLTGTVLPGLLAFFSGPVGWTVLAVAAVVAMAIAFREPIMQFVSWLGGALSQGFAAAWELVKGPVMAYWEWWKGTATWALEALMAIAYQVWVQPWVNLWEKVLRKPVTAATTWMQETWQKLADFLPQAMGRARDGVVSVWTGVVNTIRSVVNQVMSTIGNAINGAISMVNNAIAAFNRLPGPDIDFVSQAAIPQFATGGYVTRPTIAQIGEGGEPEYVVPRSKAVAFASNIAAGRTGHQALMPDPWGSRLIRARIAAESRATGGLHPLRTKQIIDMFTSGNRLPDAREQTAIKRFTPWSRSGSQGGVAFPRRFPSGASTMERATGTEVRSLGPVEIKQNFRVDSVQRNNGQDTVTLDEAQRMASNAAQDAVNQMIRLLQQPSFQQQVGLR